MGNPVRRGAISTAIQGMLIASGLCACIGIAGRAAHGTTVVARAAVGAHAVATRTVLQVATRTVLPAGTDTPPAHRHRTRPRIALTFDDGPSPYYTQQVLDTLHRFGIRATFFVIGRQAAAFPDLVRAEAAAGHEVENHTWNHADLTRVGPDRAANEIANTAGEVLLLTGRAPRYLRPPYGHQNADVRLDAAAMGEDTILWNVDPRDWSLPGAWYIQYNVLATARDGAVVIMHDGGGRRDETVTALQTLIPRLKARGFQFVTVQQLFDPLMPAALPPPRAVLVGQMAP